jgi:hypothetical protein
LNVIHGGLREVLSDQGNGRRFGPSDAGRKHMFNGRDLTMRSADVG